jgi:O-6-methylguanine DNA methyltransferase
MEKRPILALMYDFDKTLSPRDMQEYAFIPAVGMTAEDFWAECNRTMLEYQMDQILAYMYVMFKKARGKFLFTRDTLRELGREVALFPGVEAWFARVNRYAEERGLRPEHYIISSGLKEIIEGTPIAREFEKIYAAEYCYDENNEPFWPAMAVNFTSKTQFLFRVNKGVFDVTDNDRLNEHMPEEKRRVPFRNMIYIGDGLTDVPCMRLVRSNGGHSIAVYQSSRERVNEMLLQGRVDYVLQADYSPGGELEQTVFSVVDQVAAENRTLRLHIESKERAQKEQEEKRRREWEASRKKGGCPMSEIHYAIYAYPFCSLKIGCTDEAIVSITFTTEPSGGELSKLSARADAQLKEYFAGTRKCFDLPLAPTGTEFQKKVWQALQSIPYGETRSYKQLAEELGNDKAARAVGGALNKNPLAIVVPCHRVLGSNGSLTGFAGGTALKAALLKLERKEA